MKYFNLLLFLFAGQLSRGQQSSTVDAASLLGYPARQLSNHNKTEQGVQKEELEYQAVGEESSHLYVSVESYVSAAEAKKMMTSLNVQNGGMPGWEQAYGFADEAIKDSDGAHFRLAIMRKGRYIVRLKINRLAPHSASLRTMLHTEQDILYQKSNS